MLKDRKKMAQIIDRFMTCPPGMTRRPISQAFISTGKARFVALRLSPLTASPDRWDA